MEWIKDRMPDEEHVIGAIKMNNGRIVVAEIIYDTDLGVDFRIVMGNYGRAGGSDYFHENRLMGWMPLPEYPDKSQ